MKLSIVIISYKVPYQLLLCLESLEAALKDIKHEIFVVDNNSQDNTKMLTNKFFPYVNFIQNKKNTGFAKANNQAIAKVNGEYIALVNPDTVIAEDTFSILFKMADQYKDHGILGLQMQDGTGEFLPESKVNKLTPKRAAFRLLGLSNSFFNNQIPVDANNPTYTLVGAFMFFKKADYQSIEGLDESYFMYGEDIDLSHQFIKSGKQNYYIGSTSIIHFKGESTLKDTTYLNRFFKSIMIYFDKYYSHSKWMRFWVKVFFGLAKPIKKMQSAKRTKNNQPKRVVVFSDNASVAKQMTNSFSIEVKQLSAEKIKNYSVENSIVIFDMGSLKYKDAIDFMKRYNKNNNSYRFKPKTQDVLIGSDSRTSMGEIKHLKN